MVRCWYDAATMQWDDATMFDCAMTRRRGNATMQWSDDRAKLPTSTFEQTFLCLLCRILEIFCVIKKLSSEIVYLFIRYLFFLCCFVRRFGWHPIREDRPQENRLRIRQPFEKEIELSRSTFKNEFFDSGPHVLDAIPPPIPPLSLMVALSPY